MRAVGAGTSVLFTAARGEKRLECLVLGEGDVLLPVRVDELVRCDVRVEDGFYVGVGVEGRGAVILLE